jgi:hypothetical protein
MTPADRSAHHHDRGDPDDDSDQGQKSPQFMGENRLQGNLQSIGIEGKEGFHGLVLTRALATQLAVRQIP